MTLALLLYLLAAYLSGAIPWSVWLGRALYHTDPRTQADRNPGAANAFRIGGARLGILVLLLDFSKAFWPVFIAQWGLALPLEQLFWVMLLPTLGHAFSIFLGGRGGRALVTLFGVWAGYSLYVIPLVMGGAALLSTFATQNVYIRTLAVPLALLLFLLLTQASPWLVLLVGAQLSIIGLKLAVYLRQTRANAVKL